MMVFRQWLVKLGVGKQTYLDDLLIPSLLMYDFLKRNCPTVS